MANGNESQTSGEGRITPAPMDSKPTATWGQLQEWDRWSTVRRLPKRLRELCETEAGNVFIGGGYIRSCVSGEPVNDIDVFAKNADESKRLVEKLGGDVQHDKTKNAYTMTIDGIHTQFIHRWGFEHPQQCAESFDFTIAKAIIWFGTAENERYPKWLTLCDSRFYADLAGRRLVYTSPVRNEDAGGSLLRVLKFYQRGYRIPLDSMGAVVARLMQGVRRESVDIGDEVKLGKVVTGLLREVDPLIDPFASAHIETVGKLEL